MSNSVSKIMLVKWPNTDYLNPYKTGDTSHVQCLKCNMFTKRHSNVHCQCNTNSWLEQ